MKRLFEVQLEVHESGQWYGKSCAKTVVADTMKQAASRAERTVAKELGYRPERVRAEAVNIISRVDLNGKH